MHTYEVELKSATYRVVEVEAIHKEEAELVSAEVKSNT